MSRGVFEFENQGDEFAITIGDQGATVEVESEHTVDSYNVYYRSVIVLPPAKVIELRDFLIDSLDRVKHSLQPMPAVASSTEIDAAGVRNGLGLLAHLYPHHNTILMKAINTILSLEAALSAQSAQAEGEG